MSEQNKEKFEILQIEETEYLTTLTSKFRNRKNWEAPNPKMVMSYIPGTILDIFVKEGDEVKEGDNLLLLEAMKMRNKVTAPISGTIKSICITTNEIVPKNKLLIEFK